MLGRFFLFFRGAYKQAAAFPRWLPGGIVFSRKETALVSHLDDGSCVVFNLSDRMSYLLNETAGIVIGLSDGGRSIRAVAREMCDIYRIDDRRKSREIVGDVKRVYRRLSRFGIVSREGKNR
ncbi:MAG: PqqD family protein [Deltaproteobacteria bacterium]|nr:PqqD family protein [Candidatus Zymogenaceae bacterium]